VTKRPQIFTPQAMPSDLIPSPCVSICALDENDVCVGCYRTGGEITDWFMASNEEKRAILRAASERRAEAGFNGLT
jgi:predicted Fe-S protein YdhL (DUF1289 family)